LTIPGDCCYIIYPKSDFEVRGIILAHHRDAKKRLRQNENRRLRNKAVRTQFRGKVRACREAIARGEAEQARAMLKQTDSALRVAVRKGVIHKNTADRYISRLTRQVNSLSTPPSAPSSGSA
jgi:small subunit ribosomal protein S20